MVMRCDRDGTCWEDFFLSFEVANRVTKEKREEYGISFKRRYIWEEAKK